MFGYTEPQRLLDPGGCRFRGSARSCHWGWHRVAKGLGIRGNLIPDAQLAVLLRQHGVRTLCTHDADFRNFSFLEIRDPLA